MFKKKEGKKEMDYIYKVSKKDIPANWDGIFPVSLFQPKSLFKIQSEQAIEKTFLFFFDHMKGKKFKREYMYMACVNFPSSSGISPVNWFSDKALMKGKLFYYFMINKKYRKLQKEYLSQITKVSWNGSCETIGVQKSKI